MAAGARGATRSTTAWRPGAASTLQQNLEVKQPLNDSTWASVITTPSRIPSPFR